jgi:hypothetical protein
MLALCNVGVCHRCDCAGSIAQGSVGEVMDLTIRGWHWSLRHRYGTRSNQAGAGLAGGTYDNAIPRWERQSALGFGRWTSHYRTRRAIPEKERPPRYTTRPAVRRIVLTRPALRPGYLLAFGSPRLSATTRVKNAIL